MTSQAHDPQLLGSKQACAQGSTVRPLVPSPTPRPPEAASLGDRPVSLTQPFCTVSVPGIIKGDDDDDQKRESKFSRSASSVPAAVLRTVPTATPFVFTTT